MMQAERFYAAAFFAQQATEKGLKAVHIDRLRILPPPSHDLLLLARAVGAPSEMATSLRRLIPDFIRSRYPDASGSVPAELYDRAIAQERVTIAEGVMAWIRQQIKP
jgi:HEPN domain-containing protein